MFGLVRLCLGWLGCIWVSKVWFGLVRIGLGSLGWYGLIRLGL